MLFRNYSSRLSRALITIIAGIARACSRKDVYKETAKNQTYLEIPVPYLNNPSEETTFRSNKIKEQHETMKLQNEEIMLRNT